MLLGWGRRSVTLLYSMGKVVGFVCGSGRERCGGSRELMGVCRFGIFYWVEFESCPCCDPELTVG